MTDCWYKKTCKNYKESCNQNCIRYSEMYYMIESANIPKGNQFKNELIPQTNDLENFKFLVKSSMSGLTFSL